MLTFRTICLTTVTFLSFSSLINLSPTLIQSIESRPSHSLHEHDRGGRGYGFGGYNNNNNNMYYPQPIGFYGGGFIDPYQQSYEGFSSYFGGRRRSHDRRGWEVAQIDSATTPTDLTDVAEVNSADETENAEFRDHDRRHDLFVPYFRRGDDFRHIERRGDRRRRAAAEIDSATTSDQETEVNSAAQEDYGREGFGDYLEDRADRFGGRIEREIRHESREHYPYEQNNWNRRGGWYSAAEIDSDVTDGAAESQYDEPISETVFVTPAKSFKQRRTSISPVTPRAKVAKKRVNTVPVTTTQFVDEPPMEAGEV